MVDKLNVLDRISLKKNKNMSHNLTDVENIVLPPEKRIQQLSLLSSKIELNTNIAARK